MPTAPADHDVEDFVLVSPLSSFLLLPVAQSVPPALSQAECPANSKSVANNLL